MPSGGTTGGGGSFNGGTITQPLAIDSSGTPGTLLELTDSANPAWGVAFDESDNGGGNLDAQLSLQGAGTGDAIVRLRNADDSASIELDPLGNSLFSSNINAAGAPVFEVDSAFWGSLLTVFSDSIDFGAPVQFQSVAEVGFYGATPASKPTVTGAKLPSDAVMASLLSALSTLGLVTDSTT